MCILFIHKSLYLFEMIVIFKEKLVFFSRLIRKCKNFGLGPFDEKFYIIKNPF